MTEFLRGRVKGSLGILNGHLGKSRFAVGDAPTIADFSLCGYLFWPDEFGVSWSPIREAISRLVAEGLITTEESRGYRVAHRR